MPDSTWLLEYGGGEPMLAIEADLARNGWRQIAGIDEAGRGPLAGPIVAAAVVLAHPVPGVDDSKKLNESQRADLFGRITGGPHCVAVHAVSAEDIDRIGIQRANYLAMKCAAESLAAVPDFLLVDGFQIRGCAIPQSALIKGDQRSQSIAAASILAKVTRDRIMCAAARSYPEYGFELHKGYGTAAHLAALGRHGPCAIHRRSFAPIATQNEPGVLFP